MEVERHKNRPNVGNEGGPETSINNNNSNNINNKEHDRFLPIANVGRIMKKVIPANGKISKDAKETVQECVSEFISFVTGEASDKCQREKRKTINGDDVVWAISTLGFEDYVNPLKQYLHKYRELEEEKLRVPKQQQQRSDQQQQPQFQQQQQQQQQQHLEHEQIMSYNSIYTPPPTSTFMSMPSFVSTDQSLPMPFPPTSIQRQLHYQQEDIDSVGHW